MLIAEPGEHYSGYGKPGAEVTIVLKDVPGGAILSTIHKTANASNGYFSGAAAVQAGRELSSNVASDAQVTVPVTSVGWASVDHVLSGQCLASRPMMVYWFDSTIHRFVYPVDGSGSFSIDFDTYSLPVPGSGTTMYINCYTAAGDQVDIQGLIP